MEELDFARARFGMFEFFLEFLERGLFGDVVSVSEWVLSALNNVEPPKFFARLQRVGLSQNA